MKRLGLMTALACIALAIGAADSLARAKPPPLSVPARGCQPLDGDRGVADLDGDGRNEQLLRCKHTPGANERRCDRLQLVLSRSGRHYSVAHLCHGGLGVAGRADQLRVVHQGHQLVLRRHGGSAWSWQADCVFDLQRRRVTKLVRRGRWTVEPRRHCSTAIVDFRKGTSEVRWTAPFCTGRGKGRQPARALFQGAYRPIPLVRMMREPSWPPRQHARRCQLSLASVGYKLRGKLRNRHDLTLRLWAVDLAGKALLVRGALRDDHLTSRDRLHLWLGQAPSGYTESCLRRRITEHFIGSGLTHAELSLRAKRSPKKAGRSEGLSGRALTSHGWRYFELRLSTARRRQALRYGIAVGYTDVDASRTSTLLATAKLDVTSGIGLGELTPSLCYLDKQGRLQHRRLHSCATVLP